MGREMILSVMIVSFLPSLIAVTCNELSTTDLEGTIIYSPDTVSPFDIGTMAIYECNSGYQATGVRTCIDVMNGSRLGVWNGTNVTCELIGE